MNSKPSNGQGQAKQIEPSGAKRTRAPWGFAKVEFAALWPEVSQRLDNNKETIADIYKDLKSRNRTTIHVQTFYTHCREFLGTGAASKDAPASSETAVRRTDQPSEPIIQSKSKVIRPRAGRDLNSLTVDPEDLLSPSEEPQSGDDSNG
tara:strand:- start:2202 stop:2648 length:447 start_codon:yes stop_codon:yes gene_type:complete